MEFYNILSSMRKSKGLSQEELAEKIGVSRQAISKWENGISSPEMMQLKKLCEFFETTPNELLGYENKNEQEEKNVVVSAPQRPWYKALLIVIAGILAANLIIAVIPFAIGAVMSMKADSFENTRMISDSVKSFEIIGKGVVGHNRIIEIEFVPSITDSKFEYLVGVIDENGYETLYPAKIKAGICRAEIELEMHSVHNTSVIAIIKDKNSENVMYSEKLATIKHVDKESIGWI